MNKNYTSPEFEMNSFISAANIAADISNPEPNPPAGSDWGDDTLD